MSSAPAPRAKLQVFDEVGRYPRRFAQRVHELLAYSAERDEQVSVAPAQSARITLSAGWRKRVVESVRGFIDGWTR